jgi:hypothetical protein
MAVKQESIQTCCKVAKTKNQTDWLHQTLTIQASGEISQKDALPVSPMMMYLKR